MNQINIRFSVSRIFVDTRILKFVKHFERLKHSNKISTLRITTFT